MDITRSKPLTTSLAAQLQAKLEEKGGKSWYKKKEVAQQPTEPTTPPEVEKEKEIDMPASVLEHQIEGLNQEELEQFVKVEEEVEELVEEGDIRVEPFEQMEDVVVDDYKIQLKDEITNKFEFELIDKSLRRIPDNEVRTIVLAEVAEDGSLVSSKSPDFSRENYPLQPHTARLIKKFLLADKFRFRTQRWEAFFRILHDKTNPRLEVTVIKFIR